MSRRLPPLTALRAFEAVARHGSSTLAAKDLFVTHGAISRQIKQMEAWLGVTLFDRQGRRLVLSAAGRAYQQAVTAAFDAIATATDTLQRMDTAIRLTVNTPPTFTLRWLLPRLARFRQGHPSIEVRLVTSGSPLDQPELGFEVAIRRGPLAWPGYRHEVFLIEWELPVCSPRILASQPINSPRDFVNHVLLEAESRPGTWKQWLAAAGVVDLVPVGHHVFDRYNLCLQAAIDGVSRLVHFHC